MLTLRSPKTRGFCTGLAMPNPNALYRFSTLLLQWAYKAQTTTMVAVRPRHFTVSEYHRMSEFGILPSGERTELCELDYQSQMILAETLDITPLAFPDCIVAIRALLPPMAPPAKE
jgi:hypothetical protein